jgi:hypothetical protein
MMTTERCALIVYQTPIREISTRNPLDVFVFAIKHDDVELRKHAVPLTVTVTSEAMRTRLNLFRYNTAYIAWVCYSQLSRGAY